jgi:predicted nucleotide-binding protein
MTSEADSALQAVGAPTTPHSWAGMSRATRGFHLRRLLGSLDEATLSDLFDGYGLTLGDDRAAPTTDIEGRAVVSTAGSTRTSSAVNVDGPIFVVHGRDHAILHYSVRVLKRATDRKVVVLHEQANTGRTLVEKFEDHAAGASFAVVLLTGDDEGRLAGSTELQPRARQNVILELGFFFGLLGRSRVAVLVEPGVEQPSDVAGLVYIPIDAGGAWKYELAREMEAAHINVDRASIP